MESSTNETKHPVSEKVKEILSGDQPNQDSSPDAAEAVPTKTQEELRGESIKKLCIDEFTERAFKGQPKNFIEMKYKNASRTLHESIEKYQDTTGEHFNPELLINAIMDEKKKVMVSILSKQVKGMSFKDLLALEITTSLYSVKHYEFMAYDALKEKDYLILSVAVNNLFNWTGGQSTEFKALLEVLVDADILKEDIPKELHDNIRSFMEIRRKAKGIKSVPKEDAFSIKEEFNTEGLSKEDMAKGYVKSNKVSETEAGK